MVVGMNSKAKSVGIAGLLLIIGGVNLYFANGIHATPFAAWLAPIFLLRFSRTTRPWIGPSLLGVIAAIATWLGFRGLIPVGEAELIALSGSAGFVVAIVFLIDRLIAPRLGGIAATLVYPTATVTALLIGSLGAPFGTWGNDAYIQYEFLWLSRLSSILGLWGVAFLPAWFAAIVNQWIEGGFRSPRRQTSAVVFAVTLIIVLGNGILAGMQWRNASNSVIVGLIGGLAGRPDYGDCEQDDGACRGARLDRQYNEPLFARSAALVAQGAGIIAWPEAGAVYPKSVEPEFLERLSRFATDNDVYLVAGLAALPDTQSGLIENKVVIFAPNGRRSEPYFKAYPVPGEPVVPGDGSPMLFDTRYGRIAALICFDADFTGPARAAARAGAELLVIPSNDWAEISSLHAEMAAFRAMETGLPIVRPTTNGLSAVIAPTGTITAAANSFIGGQDRLLAPVRLSARPTIQRQLGDAFGWLCVLALIALIGLGVLRSRATHGQADAIPKSGGISNSAS
jgi:apolipoprotein N-acyltransferase